MTPAPIRLSAIVLAYNEADTIGRCLESLLAQTEPPDEIIVVNNNSTDDTAAVARQYPVRVVDEAQQGFIPARDRGFGEAQFPLMARVDADGIVPPSWLAVARELHRANPLAVGFTGPVHYHDLPLIGRLSFPFPGNQLWMRLVGCWPTLVGPNMILTKAAWDQVKPNLHRDDRVVHEDMDLSIHLRRQGEIVYDRRLAVTTSARRLVHRPGSFFLEYPLRNIRTLVVNRRHLGRRRARHKL